MEYPEMYKRFVAKAILGLGSLILLLSPLMPLAVKAANPNLIANASMESSSGTTPQNWSTGNWGTNSTTFSYENTGHTGSRSLKTTMSSYSSGDAKWYFAPVAVQAGSQYTFSDYYQSTTGSQLIAQFQDGSGNLSYLDLGSDASSSNWNQGSFNFTVPASATKVTIFHLINSAGSLTIDDASLSVTEVAPPPAVGTNLVINPSLETGNAGDSAPQGWSNNKWGTNTAQFSYSKTDGYQSTRSVGVTMSGYSSGDAKWFFAPVAVKANTTYAFTDYYKSTVVTHLVAVSYDANNNPRYTDLSANVPASSAWKAAAYEITTAADTKTLSVLHVIEKNGNLQIDNVNLSEETPVITTGSIPNPSLEQVSPIDPTSPQAWIKSSWGNNKPTFTYMNEGHTGKHSVKVQVSNYVDGDAKWYFTPQALQRGAEYRFSTWYKTNATPHVVAMFTLDDGTNKFFGMPNPQPSTSTTNWQSYSDTFIVPNNAKDATVFFFMPGNGWVQVDDQSIGNYQPVGFNRPLVSLTFDDGFEENNQTVLPLLNSLGFKSTQCYATQFVAEDPNNANLVKEFYNTGHEICSHTVTHPFLTQLTKAKQDQELSQSQQYLQNIIGVPVRDYASPYGDYNQAVNTEIKKYYRSHRTVDEGYNSKDNFDPYRIRVQNLQTTTTMAEYQSWLDRAKADHTWLVLVYHKVSNTDLEQFDTTISDFGLQMQALKNSGLTVKTYSAALDELTAQL